MTVELAALLEGVVLNHGIACMRAGNQVLLNLSGVKFHCNIGAKIQHSTSVVVQTDFGTEAPALGDRTIWNSFAGVGVDEDAAVGNGLAKFLLGPFHVLLSALTGHECDQAGEEWQTVSGKAGQWRVCGSALITQGFIDPTAVPFSTVQHQLTDQFANEALAGIHWAEVFFAFLNGESSSVDVQLDGQPWQAGAEIVIGWNFDAPSGYCSGRYFFIALTP